MMKSLLALGAVAAPLSAQTSVTIYNDGRVLVRREVSVSVPKGSSSHQVTLGPLDPASLFPLDSGVAITRVSYDGATDEVLRSLGARFTADAELGQVSVVGAGMRSHPGVAGTAFATLEENGIEPVIVTTSPIRISSRGW